MPGAIPGAVCHCTCNSHHLLSQPVALQSQQPACFPAKPAKQTAWQSWEIQTPEPLLLAEIIKDNHTETDSSMVMTRERVVFWALGREVRPGLGTGCLCDVGLVPSFPWVSICFFIGKMEMGAGNEYEVSFRNLGIV